MCCMRDKSECVWVCLSVCLHTWEHTSIAISYVPLLEMVELKQWLTGHTHTHTHTKWPLEASSVNCHGNHWSHRTTSLSLSLAGSPRWRDKGDGGVEWGGKRRRVIPPLAKSTAQWCMRLRAVWKGLNFLCPLTHTHTHTRAHTHTHKSKRSLQGKINVFVVFPALLLPSHYHPSPCSSLFLSPSLCLSIIYLPSSLAHSGLNLSPNGQYHYYCSLSLYCKVKMFFFLGNFFAGIASRQRG